MQLAWRIVILNGRLAACPPSQARCLTSKLIDDFEAHLAGGAGDDAEGGFVVASV
jgi:hypothetical protein